MPDAIDQPTRRVPLLIWIVVIQLGIEGIGNLQMAAREPIALWWFTAKVCFIAGLLRGWRWMFYLYLVVTIHHACCFWGVNVIAVGLNTFDALATLASWRYFFRSTPAELTPHAG